MHEPALSQSIASLVCQCGRREGFERVTRVVVEGTKGATALGPKTNTMITRLSWADAS